MVYFHLVGAILSHTQENYQPKQWWHERAPGYIVLRKRSVSPQGTLQSSQHVRCAQRGPLSPTQGWTKTHAEPSLMAGKQIASKYHRPDIEWWNGMWWKELQKLSTYCNVASQHTYNYQSKPRRHEGKVSHIWKVRNRQYTPTLQRKTVAGQLQTQET